MNWSYRNRSTEPRTHDEEEHEDPDLGDEPEDRPPAAVEHAVADPGDRPGRPPAAQEQGRGDRRRR